MVHQATHELQAELRLKMTGRAAANDIRVTDRREDECHGPLHGVHVRVGRRCSVNMRRIMLALGAVRILAKCVNGVQAFEWLA